MRLFQLAVPLYFGFAVIFDLYNAIHDIITESSSKGPDYNSTHINSTFVSETLNSTNYTNFF